MKKLVAVLLVLISFQSQASHTLGLEMYSKHISGVKYEFTLIMYRDCSKVPARNPSNMTHIYCPTSGKLQRVSMTRVSIKDITNICPKASIPCKPSNTSGGNYGVEEHLYKVTIDFSKAPYSYLMSCGGELEFRTLICCRSSLITTGPGTRNIFHSMSFNPNKTPNNSSPRFTYLPDVKICNASPTYLNFNAIDPDGDSLSYHIEEAQIDSTRKVSYSSGYNGHKPLTTYDPKNNGAVNPKADPPIGFYLDSSNGQVIFTPVTTGQGGIIRVAVKEWRKDSTGKQVEIGRTAREIAVFVVNCKNNPPTFTNKQFDFSVCEGSDIRFAVNAADKVVVPPPPAKKPNADTVTYSMGATLTSATLTMTNKKSLWGPASFYWKPAEGMASDKPYQFLITIKDDNCPIPAQTTKLFTVKVNKLHKSKTAHTELSCGVYAIESVMDSSLQKKAVLEWMIFDTSGIVLDNNLVAFRSSKSSIGNGYFDTVRITNNGTYFLRLQTTVGNCRFISYDTLQTDGNFKMFAKKRMGLCKNDSFSFTLDSSLKKRYLASVLSHNGIVGDSVSGIMIGKPQAIYFNATGQAGCTVVDSAHIFLKNPPVLAMVSDTVHCFKTPLVLETHDTVTQEFEKTKYLWSNFTITSQTTIGNSGRHWVSAYNTCGSSADTFNVVIDSIHQPSLGPDRLFCDHTKATIGDNSNKQQVIYQWKGVLDTFGYYAHVDTTGLYSVTATSMCGVASDTIFIEFLKSPIIPNWDKQETFCDQVLDTLNVFNSGSSYIWFDGDTVQKKTITKQGIHWARITNRCGIELASKEHIIIKTPLVKLRQDTSVHKPFVVWLDAGVHDSATYLWNTGERIQLILANTFGTYWVEVKNKCGTSSDTIKVEDKASVERNPYNNISVYPNPSNGLFYVTDFAGRVNSIQVVNSVGQVIPASFKQNGNVFEVKVKQPTVGLYSLRVYTSNHVFRGVILLQ
ncbi:MAG: hypothetical protein ACI9JN_000386 [Bacteroidia bacterium]|jgi:hypothetical protein